MSKKLHFFQAVALPVGLILQLSQPQTAAAQTAPASAPSATGQAASPAELQEVIVTARRREENLQRVPVAITALSATDLKIRQVQGGYDLEQSVPNMTFTRAAFGATDYQIRGIGYQVVSTSADAGVGVDENNVPLVVNRLADADFFDVQRVEVSRGPQGTLYGRNATGGVVDTITNQPTDQFESAATVDVGNYSTAHLQGFVNLPLSSMFDLRIAADSLNQSGFKYNSVTGDNIDGRDLYSTRVTLSFKPNDHFRSYLMWEHYNEDDSRFDEKFVCAKDPGPSSVGGTPVDSVIARDFLSRGCLDDSIYSQAAQTGTVNTMATLTGSLGYLYGLLPGDVNGNSQPANLRTSAEGFNPSYKATNDLVELNNEWDITDALKLTSLTGFTEDYLATRAQFESASIPFNATPVSPGGVVTDPQTGSSSFLNLDEDYDNYSTRQWTEELRLQSSFSGPINFNLGAFYMNLDRNDEIFILSNGSTAVTQMGNLLGGSAYIDPNSTPDGLGHNYYYSANPYTLSSTAGFGELYWQPTSTLRVTAGLRYTDDQKTFIDLPVTLLSNGEGFPSSTTQRARFDELTGKFDVDWSPELSFTDATMLYASYSRGYKAGGFNAPNIVAVNPTYAPEFVNAYEIGTKNTLLDRTLTIDLIGFYYDYTGYQISQVMGLNEDTTNVNATIYGVEFESAWEPVRHLRLNIDAGYLHSAIDGGQSIDIFNLTQGNTSLTYLKSLTSACVGSTAGVAELIGLVNSGALPASVLTTACPTAAAPDGPYASSNPAINPLAADGVVLPTSAGVPVNLSGKQLPNAPSLTLSLGAQYQIDLSNDWSATLRGDFYYQGPEYTDIYNDPANALHAWENVNASLTFARPRSDLEVQLYCKNLLNATPITGVGVDSTSLGLSRDIVELDPRQFGLSVTKHF